MNIVFAMQVFIILSFLFAVRMRVWKTSLNSFVFIAALFLLTISKELQYFRDIWMCYHIAVMGLVLVFVMGRLSYQSFYKKYKEIFWSNCINHNRRATDRK